MGILAGPWLKSKGVRAIGTAGGPEKCKIAKANGFEEVIDYRSEKVVARVMDLTIGQGYDNFPTGFLVHQSQMHQFL